MMGGDGMGKVPVWAAHAVVLAGLFAGCGSGGTTGTSDAAASEEDAATAEGGDAGGQTACEIMECLRPYYCVFMFCGGPRQLNGCCPCQPPYFDDIQCVGDGAVQYESSLP